MARPSVHNPITKSYAIDQIEDIEHLRRVAHRMWEAFAASHWQTAHAINALMDECPDCVGALTGSRETGCDEWVAKQRAVLAGFGSV
jgi:hypothetical protein